MIRSIVLLPIGAFCFWAGGRGQWKWWFLNQKIWRRWVLPIATGAIVYWISKNIAMTLLVVTTYAFTLNRFSWGEDWLRKAIGKYAQWFLCGFMWGGSCTPYTGWPMGLLAATIGGLGVLFLMWWSNDAPMKLDQQLVEVNTGWVIVLGFTIKEVVSWLRLLH